MDNKKIRLDCVLTNCPAVEGREIGKTSVTGYNNLSESGTNKCDVIHFCRNFKTLIINTSSNVYYKSFVIVHNIKRGLQSISYFCEVSTPILGHHQVRSDFR